MRALIASLATAKYNKQILECHLVSLEKSENLSKYHQNDSGTENDEQLGKSKSFGESFHIFVSALSSAKLIGSVYFEVLTPWPRCIK